MTDFVSVEIGGLVLLEPSNFITNLISGAACWIFIKQLRKKHLKSKISLLYQIFFLGIGFSSVAAGFTHLFAYYLDGISLRVASWVFTGLGVLTMQLATAYNYFKPKLVKNVTPFFIAQFVIYCLSLAYFMNFKVVIINTSVGLLGFVVTMELFSYLRQKDAAGFRIATGISLTAFSVVVHLTKISPHPWFNYNDVAHVITTLCMVQIFLGTRQRVAQNIAAAATALKVK